MRFVVFYVILCGVYTYVCAVMGCLYPPPLPLRPPSNFDLKLNWYTSRYHLTEQLRHPETQTDLPMNGLKTVCYVYF